MAAVEKEDGYWLDFNEFNEIRIAMARVSSIGNFIANVPHLLEDQDTLLAEVGEQLVQDADHTDEIMNTLDKRSIDENQARRKAKEEAERPEMERKHMEATRDCVSLTIKQMDAQGFRGKDIVADLLAGTPKPIEEYKVNGKQAQEG